MDDAQPVRYALRLADDALILGHRLSEWCGHAPLLEEELALANIGLDLIGQAQRLYDYVGEMRRQRPRIRCGSPICAMRPLIETRCWSSSRNGDFAATIARQIPSGAAVARPPFWRLMTGSRDTTPSSGIAAPAQHEADYHLRHAREWLVRPGDGTPGKPPPNLEVALDVTAGYTPVNCSESDEMVRMLVADGVGADPVDSGAVWDTTVDAVLAEATLLRPPADGWMQTGGRRGRHTE